MHSISNQRRVETEPDRFLPRLRYLIIKFYVLQAKALAIGSRLMLPQPAKGGLGISFVRLNLIYDLVVLHLLYSLWDFYSFSSHDGMYHIYNSCYGSSRLFEIQIAHFSITSGFVYFYSF